MAEETKRFQRKLEELCALAGRCRMRLSVQQVQEVMKDEHLTAEHLQLIYQYMDQMAIEIYDPDTDDGETGGGAADTGMRRRSLELYLEELDRLPPVPEEAELQLFEKAAAGDKEASGILIERYLAMACDLASEFEKPHSGVEAEDIIQEANIGLVMAVGALEKERSLAAYRARLLNGVTDYLEEHVKMLEEMMNSDSRIVNRMNKLADTVRQLEEELGHKPSIDELSAFLELPEEDILALLRVGGNDLAVLGEG